MIDFRALAEGSLDMICVAEVKGHNHRYVYASPSTRDIMGWCPEEFLLQPPQALYTQESLTTIASDIDRLSSGQETSMVVIEAVRKDGRHVWLENKVRVLNKKSKDEILVMVCMRDVTERRQIESELRHAQKLEAIGSLAAGIAHEINTPTQFITDNTNFLKQSWPVLSKILQLMRTCQQDLSSSNHSAEAAGHMKELLATTDIDYLLHEVPQAIEQSLEGLRRVSKIVRALKEFSHPDNTERTAVDVNQAIETTTTVARGEWKYVAEIETQFDPDLPHIICQPGEFNQVILNLIVNAAHAIKEKVQPGQKGQITVSTTAVGPSVEIAIADSGTGIPEGIRPRIFEPFFTTKGPGKGTGQGLALAYNIVVKKHGGKIWFKTSDGHGTTFFVQLPINGDLS